MENDTTSTPNSISFVIKGEPASKANSRIHVMWGDRPGSIKSHKARSFAAEFRRQCPKLENPFTGDVEVEMTIWYASRRPDLDESLILDLLQFDKKTGTNYVIVNDRQIKRRVTNWGLSPRNPRVELTVRQHEVPAYLLETEPKAKRKSGTKPRLAA